MLSLLRPTFAGRAATLLCLLALLNACASASSGKKASGEAPALDMPDAEKVRELAAAPAPDVDLTKLVGPQPAERWELVAPLPDTIGHVPRQNPESWERDFASFVDGLDDAHRSEASACVARQSSHYLVANERWPDSELDTFISARCGWIGGDFQGRISYLDGDVPLDRAAEINADRIESFATDVRKSVDGPIELGLHIGRIDNNVVVTMVAAKRSITMEPRPMTFDDRGTIEGRIHDDRYEFVRAYIGEGPLQARTCQRDPAVRFPAFRFHCGGDSETDPQGRAYFELALDIESQPWADLGGTGLFVKDLSDLRYISATASVPENAEGDDALQRLAGQLNAIRASADMGPVEFSASQSDTLHQLLPHLLEAQRRDDAAASELYISAAIAGWDIGAPILSGNIMTRYTAHANPTKTMATLLTSPIARHLLFDERLSHIGLASLRGVSATSLAITGFNRVPDLSGEELVSRALNTINSAREAAGNRPLIDSDNYQQAAVLLSGAVAEGKATPTEATERIVGAMVRNMDSSVQYWTVPTDDLDAFNIPEEIVTAEVLRATVMAAPYKHPEDPWSIYRVVIMYAVSDIR